MKAFGGFTLGQVVAMRKYSAEQEYSLMLKFGTNPTITTAVEDVWDYGGTITLAETAVNIGVSSADVKDTSDGVGARTLFIIGLDANYDVLEETVVLTGRVKAVTENKFLRIYRAKVLTAGSEEDNAGNIYMYDTSDTISDGVPDTATKVFAMVTAGANQTLMAIYTIPNGYTGWLMHHSVDYGSTAAKYMSVGELVVRKYGETFQVKHALGNNRAEHDWVIPREILAKSDIKIRAALSAAGVVNADFDIILESNT